MPSPVTLTTSEPLPVLAPLIGRHIDAPGPGVFERDLLISGWVLADGIDRAPVLARSRGALIGRVHADRPRPDIAEVFVKVPAAATSGFAFRLPATRAQHIEALEFSVLALDGEEIPFWRLRFASRLAVADEADALTDGRLRSGRGLRRRLRRQQSGAPAQTAPTQAHTRGPAPEPRDPFRVVALIATYNEADIIGPCLGHLAAHGIESYLIDDGSTDGTPELAESWLGRGLLAIERIEKPAEARTAWRDILARKQALASELGADWYIHHDADEFRESPWPHDSLLDAIRWVDALGYNVIDFRVLSFPPVDDTFRPGEDPADHFLRWEEAAEYDRIQRKCWRAGYPDIELEDGGHDVRFSERQLFPVRFLLRHYPIRSQSHGTRKVLHERRERFVASEVEYGWHRQYAHVTDATHNFLHNPALLNAFDLDRLRLESMLEATEPDNAVDDEAPGARLASPANSSAPRPIEPSRAVHGFLDLVTPDAIAGWARWVDGSDEPLVIDVWDGGRLLVSTPADQPRPDLGDDGATPGFRMRTPRSLLDGRPHWIWATARATGGALQRSPLLLHAPGPVTIGRSDPDPSFRSRA
jgi:hypothetical protein